MRKPVQKTRKKNRRNSFFKTALFQTVHYSTMSTRIQGKRIKLRRTKENWWLLIHTIPKFLDV